MSDKEVNRGNFNQFLNGQNSWAGEVGKSLERSTDHIKQRIQFFDRLAVLSGAILALSIPAFASLQGKERIITHRYTSLGCAIGGWVFLFAAIVGSAATHFLLIEFYALCTTDHETSIQGVLFTNINLLQKQAMRSIGGDVADLKTVPNPLLPFSRQPWHERVVTFITISSITTIGICVLGIACILCFLIFGSF